MSRSAASKGLATGRTRVLVLGVLAALVALGSVLLIVEPTQAAFPGKNGKIVFAGDRLTPDNPIPEGRFAPDREIFVSSASGAGVVQLTHSESDDISPAFSRDGKRIVFTSDREDFLNTYDVFVMSASGAGERNVTTDDPTIDPARDTDPAFSPSGGLIAFASDRNTGEGVDNPDGDREIFTIKPDGTTLRPRAAVGRHQGVRPTSHSQGTFGSRGKRVRPLRGAAHSHSPGYSQRGRSLLRSLYPTLGIVANHSPHRARSVTMRPHPQPRNVGKPHKVAGSRIVRRRRVLADELGPQPLEVAEDF